MGVTRVKPKEDSETLPHSTVSDLRISAPLTIHRRGHALAGMTQIR
jgi:hypothetical protein